VFLLFDFYVSIV